MKFTHTHTHSAGAFGKNIRASYSCLFSRWAWQAVKKMIPHSGILNKTKKLTNKKLKKGLLHLLWCLENKPWNKSRCWKNLFQSSRFKSQILPVKACLHQIMILRLTRQVSAALKLNITLPIHSKPFDKTNPATHWKTMFLLFLMMGVMNSGWSVILNLKEMKTLIETLIWIIFQSKLSKIKAWCGEEWQSQWRLAGLPL